MQQKNEKTQELAQNLGFLIRELRINKLGYSINKFAHEYDLDVGNTCRVENGTIDVKFVTLWKISEALGITLSELVKLLETKMTKEFHFYDI